MRSAVAYVRQLIHDPWMQNEGRDETERKSWDTTQERERERDRESSPGRESCHKVKLKFFAVDNGIDEVRKLDPKDKQ